MKKLPIIITYKTAFLLIFCFLSQIGLCQKKETDAAKEIISEHKIIFSQPPRKIPVPYSIDAPMLGNGYTGVSISGKPEKQVYYFARNDFWRLKSSFDQSFPAVLGKLELDIPELEGASYLVEQDLYEAKTRSTFSKEGKTVDLETYVSAAEDLMVVKINLDGEGVLKGSIHLELPGVQEFVIKPPLDSIFPAEIKTGTTMEGIHYITRAFSEDVDIATKAACAIKILGSDSNEIELSEGNPVYVVVAFSSNFKSDDCLAAITNRLSEINTESLLSIENNHLAWWQDFWSKSHININNEQIEKQYYLSIYSMASFSRDKDFPPGIFGTCVTKERPYWNGDYHLNYNHFAPFYGLFSSNHIEQAIPCNMPVLAFQERGEYYSEKVCGIKNGIMVPVGIGPLGIETTRRNSYLEKYHENYIKNGDVEDEGLFFGQKSNSSYSIVNMSKHFYTTYDEEYTRLYYPFVKGVATFWENYLTFEDGRYVIYNDAIHEGTIGTKNPILSLGLVRLVMQTAIDMSTELQIDKARRDKWQYIKKHLSDYTYQKRKGKKVFRYTEKGVGWWNDNTLGIQHIYPGGQIGLDSDPELLQVAHNTVDVMQRWIDNNGSNSFFPAAVRIGYNPRVILNKLHKYVENTYPNGFQLDNPHGIENFSTVPNTINEMMCMGHGGVLRIFPVWPKNQDAAFSNLRVHGAFLVSSKLENGEIEFVEIYSEKGETCNLVNPWPGKTIMVKRTSGSDEILDGNQIKIETSVGEILIIKCR